MFPSQQVLRITNGSLRSGMSAIPRVIAVPELLENIMLFLSLSQMLLVQRVSKTFRDVVWDSPKLNRALFFTPSTSKSLDWHNPSECWGDSEKARLVSPILNPFFKIIQFEPVKAKDKHYVEFGLWDYSSSGRPCPTSGWPGGPCCLLSKTRRLTCDYWPPELQELCHENPWDAKEQFKEHWENLLFDSPHSFHDMLLTHPPCSSAIVDNDCRFSEPGHTLSEFVPVDDQMEAGVCIGPFIWTVSRVAEEQRWFTRENGELDGEKNTVEIVGGESWRQCRKTVDDMTGWEMLRLLETDIQDLDSSDFE